MQPNGIDLGPTGIWTFHLDALPMTAAQEQVAELAELGFGAVWIPEAVGRDSLASAALLLAGSEDVVVATGISSIWWRAPMAMNAAHRTISEAFPGRFLLGLGASHAPSVEGFLGETYERPLTKMREYLDSMDSSLFLAKGPDADPVRVLAALGPRMLALSAERAAGAHTYFVPVEHTVGARATLGERPFLAVEQAAVLESDPDTARAIARRHMAIYLGLPNYTGNLRRLGYTDDDLTAGGSDRLVDALVAWGDVDAVVERVRAQHDAGADHVCVQVLGARDDAPPAAEWRELAPALA